MARGVNKVILIGNVGQDPEVRFTPGGDAVATINLATTDSWTDRQSGQRQERTEWHRVVLWRKMAEIAQQYVKKGSKLYIEGKLQTRKWQAQDGSDRYTTEIKAMDMQMLDSRQGGQQGAQQQGGGYGTPQGQAPQGQQQGQAAPSPYAGNPRGQQSNYGAPDPGSFDDFDDEIPFDDAPGAGR